MVKATTRRNRIPRRPAINTLRSWRRSQTRCRKRSRKMSRTRLRTKDKDQEYGYDQEYELISAVC